MDCEPILAGNFAFRAPEEFFERDGYINNRVNASRLPERCGAVCRWHRVTYSNIVEDEPGGPGAWKADMTWADILVKENGKWKYDLILLIDFRDLITPDQKNE